MSLNSDINAIANVIHEVRESHETIEQKTKNGLTDPIETNKLNTLHSVLDEAIEKVEKQTVPSIKTSKIATIGNDSFKKKHNSIDDFLRGNGEMSKVVLRTKSENSGYEFSFADQIQNTLQDCCIIRKLASQVTVSGELFESVAYINPITTNWSIQGTNVAPVPSATAQNFVKKIIQTFDLTAQPQITSRMVADVQLDLEGYVLNMLCNVFAYQESNAFFNGDGNIMPRGILNYPMTTPTSAAGTTINRVSSKDPNNATITAAGLMNLYYSLSDLYTQNASFIMHKSSVYAIRTMKDTAGQYLWLPGVLSGTSDTLLGCPLYTSNYIPQAAPIVAGAAATSGNDVVIFGDIKKAYTVVDRGDLLIQRDPFSSKPYINFYTTKRIGGDVVNPSALTIMRIGNF